MTILYLVRHGKTDLIGKILCGNLPGVHLNEEGRRQAQKAADYLAAFPIRAIFSSPLERTCETAVPLAEKLNLTVSTQDFLREIDFGDFQGEGEEIFTSPIWRMFFDRPSATRFPNGENLSEAQVRVVQGINKICEEREDNEQIVCVAHCEILRLVVAHAINLPLDCFHSLTIDPASISKLQWTNDHKKLNLLNYCPA